MAAICAMVVLVAGGTTAAIATTSAAATTDTITGTITDSSGYPLPGITIRLFDDGPDDGSLVDTATTNTAGRYRFTGVHAKRGATYRLEGTDPTGAHVFLYSSFVVGPGAAMTHNATMKLAGFIQGKATTKIGTAPAQPAKHAYITAYGKNTTETVNVSAKGTFRIGGLPAGTYVLELQDGDEAFADQCYNNIRMGSDGCEVTKGATRVTVTAGKATTIAPQVFNHPTSVLGGTVTDAAGKPVEDAAVEIYAADQRRLIDDSYTKADGTWTLRGIEYVGKVKIMVRDSDEVLRDTWYVSAVDYAHAAPITVREGSERTTIHITMLQK